VFVIVENILFKISETWIHVDFLTLSFPCFKIQIPQTLDSTFHKSRFHSFKYKAAKQQTWWPTLLLGPKPDAPSAQTVHPTPAHPATTINTLSPQR
jgi:hypothetical protein